MGCNQSQSYGVTETTTASPSKSYNTLGKLSLFASLSPLSLLDVPITSHLPYPYLLTIPGNDAYESGDFDKAVEHYTEALQQQDKRKSFPLYYVNRAAALHRLDRHEEVGKFSDMNSRDL